MKFLAISAPTELDIYNAKSGNFLQKIPFTDPLSLVSLAFNSDSSLLALGFNDGQAIIY